MPREALRLARLGVVLVTLAACTSTQYRPSPSATSADASGAPVSSVPAVDVAGDRLVVLGADGNLTSIAPDGSAAVQLTSDASADVLVSQPVASPDGRYLAWVEVRADRPSIVTATRAGEVRDEIPVRIAPFFLQWDPTSRRIAYLGGLGIGIGMGVINAAIDDPQNIPMGVGSPLYLSWSPDGSEMFVHVGADTLGRTDVKHRHLQRLDDTPGTFQAPAWLPDGRTLFDRVEHDTQQLVVADGHSRHVIAAFHGGVAFEPSPDGTKVAYRLQRQDGSQTGLYVRPIDGGHPVAVTHDETTAFFWSPDSDALLLMTPEQDATAAQPVHRWRVWNGAKIHFVSQPFLPSQTFFERYVPFFDQYAQALTPWAPDGHAFTYAGVQDGGSGIWVQRVERDAAPEHVIDGDFAMWSPPES
jgi:Tol biopolymer transport system component